MYRLISVARQGAQCAVRAHSASLRAAIPNHVLRSGFHHLGSQRASASDHWPQAKSHPLVDKLRQHPHIMQQLIDFTALLQEKGFDVSGKQPSMMQIMKVMNDAEIRERVKKLAQDMQAAGIQLDMQAIAELQNSLGQHQGSGESDEQSEGKKSPVMDKVKGFFKK
ncbi:uncharacterized protein BYT42DRAFT_581542 [Radiomyces spectabilis]|uniref:uncharacterized protein n=1 Tax=Radiomyces spectabilis TaxID=64574 RepID=UPI002220E848|nr:uncharacterized protein BYT42DRAFT_581542 [Radiomyces spectabilis]KAI8371775.1 hypothetical protein BYT42DRAFT_581542 [Radiomyces spectabilis]